MSATLELLPVIDLSAFLNDPNSEESKKLCEQVLHVLHETSCLVIKDPRVQTSDNAEFIDMMEDYYNLPYEVKAQDARPEASFQVGTTPEFTEVPRDNSHVIEKLALKGENAPLKPNGPDPKWRFFWPVGPRPSPDETMFPVLNHKNVIPKNFPQWETVMEKWGNLMLNACQTVAQMVAVGAGLEMDAFTRRMHKGPHLLAPTGSDVGKYNKIGTVFAGFHYDLNFLTIHGKSRYPGLFIWLRNGTKVPVKVPEGCLLIQAGKQMEWLTGGYITAGYHEVIVTEATVEALNRQKQAGRPLWRVSSTLFSHIASDQVLEPLKSEWKELDKDGLYQPILTGDQVNKELQAINLQKQN
jgi:isopenicillin N synthase-like dioxygenase